MRKAGLLLVAVLSAAPSFSWAALSANLFNGDFESVTSLKNEYSYDRSSNAIGAHRFNSDAETGDWGKWLGGWGPPSYCFNGYCGQGGFSTVDYPRQVGYTMVGEDLGNNNRSVDPYDPSGQNHIMETIAYYPTMTQWVKAPANQKTGPVQFSFDFFYNNWDPSVSYDQLQVTVYGSNFAPPHNVGLRYSPVTGSYSSGIGSAYSPTGPDNEVNYTDPRTQITYRSKRLAQFGWGDWWTDGVGDPETSGWAHVTSTTPTAWWDDVDGDAQGSVIIPVSLTETFLYYSITVSSVIYDDAHEYAAEVSGYGVNGYDAGDTKPAIGFDNFVFRVSINSGAIRGDLNGDGMVNALDIGPFVARLTQGGYQDEADINQDNLVNALDISGFVTCLINGGCAGEAGGSAVPEPASLAMLAAAGLLTLRRR